jgi:purine-nucleoside phosphorylase
MQEITFPLYVLKMFGVRQLFISNAAGNLNPYWKKGQLMMITDHINLLPENPLRGAHESTFGPRFPDMSMPYDKDLADSLRLSARACGILLQEGVYVSVQGPNLETRAEYRYLRGIGADAVGMSTVPEVIVANFLGLPVCAVSVLTDDCDPDNLSAVDISEIFAIAGKAEKILVELIKDWIKKQAP